MRRISIALAALLVAATFLTPAVGTAAPEEKPLPISDVRQFSPPKDPALITKAPGLAAERERLAGKTLAPAVVGDTRFWLGLDDFYGEIYVKEYTLRGVGDHIEVWVASDSDAVSSDLEFPAGDCRNDGVRTVVTDEQIQYLMDEFDSNMYPVETTQFSVPPPRDGMDAPLADILALPTDYYAGDGEDTVVLVDNFRDDQFYDTNNANSYSYIAGFYWGLYDYYFNRLVMNIDGWDWVHRTGPNPPDEPSTDPCTNAPARPYTYESVFAHEYQHLLEGYADWDEVPWVNEGLSMYAEPLTGYADWLLGVNDVGFPRDIQCFLGNIVKPTDVNLFPFLGGPENSLTLWGDQTDSQPEILCDYGAAGIFTSYLAQQYGESFLSRLHTNKKNGLAGLQNLLDRFEGGVDAMNVIDRWAAMVAVDGWLDKGADLVGMKEGKYQLDLIHGNIYWANDQAYENPGAPPNGSDYVRFRDASDHWVSVKDVNRIAFDGATELAPSPVEWTVDNTTGSPPASLYSGMGDNLDRAIIQEVTVGAGVLTFDSQWNTEAGYDWAYVQVSTDGGESYTSIACTDSINGALGPAFEDDSGGWVTETCDLSPYAGQTILLSFRYVTDGGVAFDGFWVDNVDVDGTLVSDGSTLDGWSSMTEINPFDADFTVRLVSYNKNKKMVYLGKLALDENNDGSLGAKKIAAMLGSGGKLVAAIVTFHDPTELAQQAAPYMLNVNGVLQPGGS